MRIAITADPMIPVPPVNYGGIERIIHFLVKEFKNLGHTVLLVAHADSERSEHFLSFKNDGSKLRDHFNNVKTINQIKTFNPDVIHSFSRLAYLLPFIFSDVPKIMSYQREPTIRQIKKAITLFGKNSITFTGCSDYIRNQFKTFSNSETIYNGVDLNLFKATTNVDEDAPLIFLGRIEPIKGTHVAIEVAKRTNRKLIIAGNISVEYQSYFDNIIKPELGGQITYIGAVNDFQKNELLGMASALLMPILWDEPFGIVMAEAMACGTPVIGFEKGAVPEIIKNGLNGYLCKDLTDMVQAICDIDKISRVVVRLDCEQRFSSNVIANQYLNLYNKLIG